MTNQNKKIQAENRPHFDLSKLDKITAANDQKLLIALGLDPDQYGDLQCSCPVHGGDNPTGFTYDSKIKRWRCWTHKCHENKMYGTGLVGLIRGIRKCSFMDAISFIKEVTGYDIESVSDADLNTSHYINNRSKGKTTATIFYDNRILSNLNSRVKYFLDQDFKYETLKYFYAFYCDNRDKPLYGRACFPIIDINSNIVGFCGRQTPILAKDNTISHYTVKWKYLCDIGNHLFNLNNLPDNEHTVCLVEGIKDVMRMHEAGITNAISPFSCHLTESQRKLLIKKKVRNIILLFDPDRAGEIGSETLIKQNRMFFNIFDLNGLLKDDPGDSTIEELQKTIKPEIDKIIEMDKQKYAQN